MLLMAGPSVALLALAAGLWLDRRMSHSRQANLLAGCVADASLLFPLNGRDSEALSHVGAREKWGGITDVLKALTAAHAVDLPGALPRKLGFVPFTKARVLFDSTEIERETPAVLEAVDTEGAGWNVLKLSGKVLAATDANLYFEPAGHCKPLAKGTAVKLSFRREGDANYEFKSFLSEHSDGARLKIRHMGRLSRLQDRQYARAPVGRLAEFGYLSENELSRGLAGGDASLLEPHVARGLLMDLSGGGAALRSNVRLGVDDLVMLSISGLGWERASDPQAGQVVGRVVDCQPEGGEANSQWMARIKFVHISEEGRKCVVRFVNQRLIEQQ